MQGCHHCTNKTNFSQGPHVVARSLSRTSIRRREVYKLGTAHQRCVLGIFDAEKHVPHRGSNADIGGDTGEAEPLLFLSLLSQYKCWDFLYGWGIRKVQSLEVKCSMFFLDCAMRFLSVGLRGYSLEVEVHFFKSTAVHCHNLIFLFVVWIASSA